MLSRMTLLAGAAEVVITPPVGTWLEGYGGKTSGSAGVHDDLHARALALDDGATQAAIVACDLIGIDRRMTARVRELAAEATGIPGANIMVTATHTHQGPELLRRDRDEGIFDMTSRLIAGAVAAAHGRRRPVAVKAGRGSVDTVSQNRRDPEGPIGDALEVLLFDSPDPRDGAVAAVVNFACHATVLYRNNDYISADYPGAAVRTVQQVLGGAPVLFLQGACGDVNPLWTSQEFSEVERVGSIVGAEAARRLQELRPLGIGQHVWNIRWDEVLDVPVKTGELVEPRLRVASRTVAVPLRKLPPPEEYDGHLRELQARAGALPPADVAARRALTAAISRLRNERGVAQWLRGGGGTLHPEVQAIGLGDGVALLALPGEFFAETAQRIRQDSGIRRLSIACYANHHVFYVVPEHEFGRGGYEPGVSILDETAEATIRQAAVELLAGVVAGG
ncbi:MAG TPA: neutral/alkaline non-lysosomal ceramidase N-terminal domain-containing protein [Dehalococcoidia bacterium]|nr:neutral/alkaline non-lysosomal ceramidase N-terminal domain-containing protein [Dehalococcoidia bacterium]